jgi:hypothetical protein
VFVPALRVEIAARPPNMSGLHCHYVHRVGSCWCRVSSVRRTYVVSASSAHLNLVRANPSGRGGDGNCFAPETLTVTDNLPVPLQAGIFSQEGSDPSH